MDNDFSFTMEIPRDEDGFVLLRCPQCGEYFKLRPNDYESDDALDVCCPACGISSDSYLTDDVMELSEAVIGNKVSESLYREMKGIERKTRGKYVSFNAGKPPKSDHESTLRPCIDSFSIATCNQCGMQVKVSRLLSMSMFVCPLCGVNNFNDR